MPDDEAPKPIGSVWNIAVAGTGAILLATEFGLFETSSNFISAIRVLLTLGGALTIGVALYLRPGHARLYVLATVAATIARFGIPRDWDSGAIAAWLAAIIAGIGAVLAALPSGYRKVAVSLLLLFHFGGIAVAVTYPPSAPWMSDVFWTIVYRPYLQAFFLTDTYRYYSPEPGSASQVWFCVKYDRDSNGQLSQRWYRFPRRPDDWADPMGVSYHRRLIITSYLEDTEPTVVSEEMKRRRLMKAQGDDGIPIHPELKPLEAQYRLPRSDVRNFLLPSYVQHVATLKMLQHPERVRIKSIRVYLVVHEVMKQKALEDGLSPYDPVTYFPFYFGEYDTSGKLLDADNPLLYWMIPIIRVPTPGSKPWHTVTTNPEEFKLIDGVKRHNGDIGN